MPQIWPMNWVFLFFFFLLTFLLFIVLVYFSSVKQPAHASSLKNNFSTAYLVWLW